MKHDLTKLYKGRFFARRKSLAWRVPIVTQAIMTELEPTSLVDIGCANADYVAEFIRLGVDAYGIEGTRNCLDYLEIDDPKRVMIADVRSHTFGRGSFDLVLCLEVAEHIEPEYVDIFVGNLCGYSRQILMSAAGPGQKGHGHWNCQPKEYWVKKFKERKYHFDGNVVSRVRKHWEPWKIKKEMSSYYKNLMYFKKAKS